MSANAPSPYEITVCRGVQSQTNCRFAMPTEDGFALRLEQTLLDSGWPNFLRANVVGPILHHHAFRIAVSACPNGCSKPHVADIGIIRACAPVVDPGLCTCCGLCQKVCPDKAIVMDTRGPIFDMEKCMLCGLCVARCPERALDCFQSGYRVVVGGKLGRHPRLATEVFGIHTEEHVVALVSACIDFYMRHYRRGLRFGTLVDEMGDALQEELDIV